MAINYNLTFRHWVIVKEWKNLKRSLLCFFVTDIFGEIHGTTFYKIMTEMHSNLLLLNYT